MSFPTIYHHKPLTYQLLTNQIDWSLVATELDISNGHAARMRYSRFKQQMEGSTTTAVSRATKPKKANGKTDLGKSVKQFPKGKNPYDKSKNFDDAQCGSSYGFQSGLKKRPAPNDLMKPDNKMSRGYGVMATENMNNFAPPMFDPFANAASYWTPSPGTILSTDTSTFPYLMSVPDVHQQKQQQQPFPVDPFANMYLGPMPPLHTGEDVGMSLNQGWAPPSVNGQFNYSHANHAAQSSATTTATPSFAGATNPSEWNNQMDLCFSGCCQQPPPYPSMPSVYPDLPTGDQSRDPLLSAPPVEPWVPPPPHNQWVPIKPEPGEEGNVDDLFVKVESDA